MSAYMILEVDITDPDGYVEYRDQAPATVEQYGGRYLVRGGEITPHEGGWEPTRLVVLEFPTVEQLWEWFNSPEYQAIYPLRREATTTRSIVVEGV